MYVCSSYSEAVPSYYVNHLLAHTAPGALLAAPRSSLGVPFRDMGQPLQPPSEVLPESK